MVHLKACFHVYSNLVFGIALGFTAYVFHNYVYLALGELLYFRTDTLHNCDIRIHIYMFNK